MSDFFISKNARNKSCELLRLVKTGIELSSIPFTSFYIIQQVKKLGTLSNKTLSFFNKKKFLQSLSLKDRKVFRPHFTPYEKSTYIENRF